MKYAIIAAGEGSRLVQEGVKVPKPLVKVAGETLIDRLLRTFAVGGAEEIVVICNEQMEAVRERLTIFQQLRQLPLRVVVKTTPSSMHSLWEMTPWLDDGPFVLTTVDTIFREAEFAAYVRAFLQQVEAGEADALMGVTPYIDDEKPLYVETDAQQCITAFLDRCDRPKYVSGGIYGLTPPCLAVLRRCVERGEQRMRNYQRALVADGLRLKAWVFPKVLDIDHAADIQKAEQFLIEGL